MISSAEVWRLLRFGLVGAAATVVDLGVSVALFHAWPNISEYLATTVAFAIAFWVSFLGHRYITFRAPGAWGRFLVVALSVLVIRNMILASLLSLGLAGLPPVLLATLVVTVITYFLSKTFVFSG